MKKSEIIFEHIKKIDLAVSNGLGKTEWLLLGILSGGLTGIPVYKIEVDGKAYAIKLEKLVDNTIEIASKQGIAPCVHYLDPEHGTILMDYIEGKPRPQPSIESIRNMSATIRTLHNIHHDKESKPIIDIFYTLYQQLPEAYRQQEMIAKCVSTVRNIQDFIFEKNDLKFCHCDLNPMNIIFDGDKYFFVDWQTASMQSFYFDLAYLCTWFYLYDENLCLLFLNTYLGIEANAHEKTKYFLMRVFVNIYLGFVFINTARKMDNHILPLSPAEIDNLPTLMQFMQFIGMGKVNLAEPGNQQAFGFVFLKNAEKMMVKYSSDAPIDFMLHDGVDAF